MISLALEIEQSADVGLALDAGSELSLTIDTGAPTSIYAGPYEANALFTPQLFATNNKMMRDDFAVHAINYTEAPNDWGTTVTIGG